MNRFGSILASVVLMAAATTMAFAQAAGPKGGPAQQGGQAPKGPKGDRKMGEGLKMHQKILAELNLSDKQKAALKELQASTMEKMKALKGAAQGDRKAAMEKMKAIRQSHQESLYKILTPEQKAKYDKKLAELKERIKRDKPAGPPPRR